MMSYWTFMGDILLSITWLSVSLYGWLGKNEKGMSDIDGYI